MPIYEYHCEDCGHVFDKFVRSMSSSIDLECPHCHSERCKKNISLFGTVSSNRGRSLSSSCAPSTG